MVCGGWLEGLVIECLVLEGQEAWDFEKVELVVCGFRNGMPRQVRVHVCECLLLDLLYGLWCPDAICPSLIIA